MIDKTHLARRVEEAGLNSWPALQQMIYDGWLLRFAEGFTKRSNSVHVLDGSRIKIESKVAECERYFLQHNQVPIFRISSLTENEALESCLKNQGYQRIEPTLVMLSDLGEFIYRQPKSDRDFRAQVPSLWLRHYYEMGEFSVDKFVVHGKILHSIIPRTLLAELCMKTTPVAMGMAVLEGELAGIFDILSSPLMRRQGFATDLVSALMEWAKVNEARYVYLQVTENNTPAIKLYKKLGFMVFYKYWYLVKSKRVSELGKNIPAYSA